MLWKTNDAAFERLFQRHVEHVREAAETLGALLSNLPEHHDHAQKIVELEHRCDDIAREAHELLDNTFITRLDKSDIVLLVDHLDDIVDCVKAVADRIVAYNVRQAPAEAGEIVRLVVDMVRILQATIVKLYGIRVITAREQLLALQRLRDEADRRMNTGLGTLLREGQDWKGVMIWKDIYDKLQTIILRCGDVIDTVVSVSRKEA
jgi:uncharacterized protein